MGSHGSADEGKSLLGGLRAPDGYNAVQRTAHYIGLVLAVIGTVMIVALVLALLFLASRWAWRAVLGIG